MKKILFAALFLQPLAFALMAPALGAEARQEFISKTMNANFQRLLKNSRREIIGEEPFSSKSNNITDHMISFYNTDHGLLVTLQALEQRFDENGRPIPDVYSSELVAIVFVDKLLLWYKSQAAKGILKTKMAQLIGKQSI